MSGDLALITPAQRRLVRLIKEHTHGLSKVYVAQANRGRWVVIAVNVVTKKRLTAVSGDTLYGLERHQLATFNTNTRAEDIGDYAGRTHLDSRSGYPIALTDGGRAL